VNEPTEEISAFVTDAPPGLLSLPESERDRLAEALQILLAAGSINGIDPNRTALYHWCRQYVEWLKEIAALAGLDVVILHEERLVQAFPRTASLRLRLKQEATLVCLALWYAGDTRWRDEGQDQAFLSVAELNDLLQDQLLPDSKGPIPSGNLRDILRMAARYNLIRFEPAEPFEESGIEVLPAIRRIIPFRDIAAWTESARTFQRQADPTVEADVSNSEEEEEES
jgi:Domain of unknown function (DUF4194)